MGAVIASLLILISWAELAVTVVPRPGLVLISRRAPISSARSRMDASPIPRRVRGSAGTSNPGPSSRMRKLTAFALARRVMCTDDPGA